MNLTDALVHLAVLLLFPPLATGVIAKVKAFAAGRIGPPLWQPYADLWRLLGKGAVYSETTSWVFRLSPALGLACVLSAGLLLPLTDAGAPISFAGDMIAFAYLLGMARFATMLGALDTGSSFEGMGASREAAFAALAEPALFLVIAALAVKGQTFSFDEAFAQAWTSWGAAAPVVALLCAALAIVLLTENARIPVDDPATHLELTMIHEVMVLDHSGPDFAFIQYGASVKLFLFCAFLVRLAAPPLPAAGWVAVLCLLGGVLIAAALVGLVESVTARLRLVQVPQFLVGAWALGAVGLMILFALGR